MRDELTEKTRRGDESNPTGQDLLDRGAQENESADDAERA